MDRYQLTRQLHSILLDLEKAEETHHLYRTRLTDIKYQIKLKESELYLKGLIDGKNEDTRKAQLVQYTSALIKEKNKLAEQLDKAAGRVKVLQRKYEAAKLTIHLLLTPSFDQSLVEESIL